MPSRLANSQKDEGQTAQETKYKRTCLANALEGKHRSDICVSAKAALTLQSLFRSQLWVTMLWEHRLFQIPFLQYGNNFMTIDRGLFDICWEYQLGGLLHLEIVCHRPQKLMTFLALGLVEASGLISTWWLPNSYGIDVSLNTEMGSEQLRGLKNAQRIFVLYL